MTTAASLDSVLSAWGIGPLLQTLGDLLVHYPNASNAAIADALHQAAAKVLPTGRVGSLILCARREMRVIANARPTSGKADRRRFP